MSVQKYDPAEHHQFSPRLCPTGRRSIRLRGHDYSGRGIYFVTILTKNRRRLFGTVVNGRLALSEAGRIAARCRHGFLFRSGGRWMPDASLRSPLSR